jgi:hypothetical protein
VAEEVNGHSVSLTECGLNGVHEPTELDVIRVADVTGAIAETNVWWEPCQAVVPGERGPRLFKPGFERQITHWLTSR